MTRAAAKPQQMAVVSIGYVMVMLPADEAMKVVKALQSAARVNHGGAERDYSGYVVDEEALDVKLALVRPGEIHMPHGEVVPPARSARAALPSLQRRLLK